MKVIPCAFAFSIFLGTTAFARILPGPPPPDDLAAPATLICNGVVESITNTDTGKNVESSEMGTYTAKIKALHVFKGKTEAELELRYKNFAWMVPNGAVQIKLEKGKRYRFFLKSSVTPNYFVGVLDGQVDDAFSVDPLLPDEPDDSPFISGTEAIQIAHKWIEQKYPGIPVVVNDKAAAKKLLKESRQTFVAAYMDTYRDNYNFYLTKISPSGAFLERTSAQILRDRTVKVTGH